jgi:hypothetical protein
MNSLATAGAHTSVDSEQVPGREVPRRWMLLAGCPRQDQQRAHADECDYGLVI